MRNEVIAEAEVARQDPAPMVSVRGLRVAIQGDETTELVTGVDFDVARGTTLGIVGESGSGKSLTCRALLGMLPPALEQTAGSIELAGRDASTFSSRDWRRIHGGTVGAVFQDPGSFLNPSIAVGKQLAEVIRVRRPVGRKTASERAIELMRSIGLRDPEQLYFRYPYELSGGMLQRILIAIAISGDPELLVADEATTALDVTVQSEILDLLQELKESRSLTLILVSHDLAVVSQVCDTVIVMQNGEIVERGPTLQLLSEPHHPYTQMLVDTYSRFELGALVTVTSQAERPARGESDDAT